MSTPKSLFTPEILATLRERAAKIDAGEGVTFDNVDDLMNSLRNHRENRAKPQGPTNTPK